MADTSTIDAEATAQNMQDAVIQKFMDLGKEEPAPAPAPAAPAQVPVPSVAAPASTAPAATPEAAPAEPSFDKPPEGLSGAAAANWKKFRETTQEVIDKKSKELAEVKKQLDEANKAIADRPRPMIDVLEHEILKKRAAELESVIERNDLANSTKFRTYYDGGISKAIKLAVSAAGPHGAEVEKLLKSPTAEGDHRLQEIVTELGFRGRAIGNAADTIAALTLEREEQLSNHAENLKLLRQQERLESESAEQRRSTMRKAKADAILEHVSSLPEFKAADTDPEHKAWASTALEIVRDGVNGKLAEDDAMLLPAAAMKAQYLETIKLPRLLKENQELKARLEEIAAARPRMGGGAAGQDTPAKEEVSSDDPWGIAHVTKKFMQAGQG